MPILTVNLATERYSQAQKQEFIEKASAAYAEVLEAPVDRIRVYLVDVASQHMGVAGALASAQDIDAPFFHGYLMKGRPPEQKYQIMRRISDLIAEVLGADIKLVRGAIWHVDPEDWCISGESAAKARAAELADRAAQQ